jgi:hypothetical protein
MARALVDAWQTCDVQQLMSSGNKQEKYPSKIPLTFSMIWNKNAIGIRLDEEGQSIGV